MLVFKRGRGRQHAMVSFEWDRMWGMDRPRLACNFTNGTMASDRLIFRGVVTCKLCVAALEKCK